MLLRQSAFLSRNRTDLQGTVFQDSVRSNISEERDMKLLIQCHEEKKNLYLWKRERRMYVCGPTVYNLIHIGNARPMIIFDTVRRYLEYKGYE